MIFALIMLVVGLATKRRRPFWFGALAALGLHVVLGTLLSGGGTLENPSGDGLITAVVRRASGDGIFMGFWALIVIVTVWALPLALVHFADKRGGLRVETPAQ